MHRIGLLRERAVESVELLDERLDRRTFPSVHRCAGEHLLAYPCDQFLVLGGGSHGR